jgi:hypothetical protein
MGDEAEAEGEGNATNPPAPATTEAEPTSVLPPSNLTVEANAFSVVLTWVAPVGDPQVEEYTVYRDGSLVSSVPAPEVSFTDEGLSDRGVAIRYGPHSERAFCRLHNRWHGATLRDVRFGTLDVQPRQPSLLLGDVRRPRHLAAQSALRDTLAGISSMTL